MQKLRGKEFIDPNIVFCEGINDVFDDAFRATVLKKLIQRGSYEVYLQPKFDFYGHLNGAEALIRYSNDDGLVETLKYLPFLENHGLIELIDLYVFENVCDVLCEWQKKKYPVIPVSLNFSRSTLISPNLLEKMNTIISQFDIKKSLLEIEITETKETQKMDYEEKQAKNICQSGYKLALDDFGVEYSNLLYLIKNPFHILKLDKSLVDEIEHNWKSRLLLESIISTCHRMNIQVIAEGVENINQFEFLRKSSCDQVQGYIMGKPVAVQEFEVTYFNENKVTGH